VFILWSRSLGQIAIIAQICGAQFHRDLSFIGIKLQDLQ
jgi:hypothetical protein